MKLQEIDVWYDARLDSRGKDPDSASKVLKEYQRLLWSKLLPNGEMMQLESGSGFYLRWCGMNFGSDHNPQTIVI